MLLFVLPFPLLESAQATKKLGWATTQRRCLNGSTVPSQAPAPDAKLAARVYRIDLHRRFARASSRLARRWRKMYRGPTRSLVAKLQSVRRCIMRISCWGRRTLRTRLRTGVCKILMPVSQEIRSGRIGSASEVNPSDHPVISWVSAIQGCP